MNKIIICGLFLTMVSNISCKEKEVKPFTGADNEVKIITLDPGHFHAALVQKSMYKQVDSVVHIYAPNGTDVDLHLKRIEGFNNRNENPTSWQTIVYKGDDYLDKMIAEKKGNLVVIAGNNRKKTNYIKTAVDAGLNVLSDKPMAIDQQSFLLLKDAFAAAENNNVLLYDIMTERYEITSKLQRELAQMPEIFGQLEQGTPENPAVVKESVHHFYKNVAGSILQRPAWYFDVNTQGEGIIDVTTHLIDLIQWVCFPDEVIDYTSDVDVYAAKRWTTDVTKPQFLAITRLSDVPDYLSSVMTADSVLQVFANGEMSYKLKGVHAKVSVIWNFAAPEGGGDTHFSVMRGSKSNIIIRQGQEQAYKSTLFIEASPTVELAEWRTGATVAFGELAKKFPGCDLETTQTGFKIVIPDSYRVGHEAHFGQVAEKYLRFLVEGKLPSWEVPNILSKYYTTTKALELAKENK